MATVQECIELCLQCATSCEICTKEMLDLFIKGGGGEACCEAHVESACPKCCLDCIEICRLCAAALARESRYAKQICQLCAEVCEWCAAECEKHSHDHCKRCAEDCRRCAECCRACAETLN